MSTSTAVQARRLVFPEKQKVFIEKFDPGQPGKDEVLVRTAISMMSTGTENIVFNRLFDPGTHWDNWVKYPFYPGYTSVGTVEAVGEGVTTLKVGDRVAVRGKHRSHHLVPTEGCFPIPDALPFEQAIWFSLAKITFHGAQAADYKLGDSVLIIGAGPIGQMSIRWARAAGATNIIVVDTAPKRMPLATAGGATATILLPIEQAREAILEANDGKLPQIVIDSTGNAKVFATALSLTANYGKVIVLGDTGAPTQQFLTPDVITRGLRIIGVHDAHNTPDWNNATISKLFFKLASTGRFNLEGLTSHVFDPDDCAEAYATANRDRASTMGLIFDWSGTLKKRS